MGATDLDLIGKNFDFVLEHLLHVLGVEVAQSHCLYALVFGNVAQGLKVLIIFVLNGGVTYGRLVRLLSGKKRRFWWVGERTYELPMKLQEIDPRDL